MDEFDPKAFLAEDAQEAIPPQPIQQVAPTQPQDVDALSSTDQEAFDPKAFLAEAEQEEYGTPGQQLKAGAEGVAKGVLGPLAPYIEKNLLHVKGSDIRARQEANPITHGIGEATGLVGSAISGTGLGGVMGKAGEAAQAAVGLGNVAKEASLGMKVGSEAVKQAAEMAVLQSGDEISKRILNDPKASTESAMTNIGLSTVLGGAFGAGSAGTAALWKSTMGPKVTEMLSGFKNHLNGGTAIMPEVLQADQKALGIEIAPEVQAALSGNPTAVESFNILKEGQNKKITESLNKFHDDIGTSVANALKIAPEDVAVHSENEAGHALLETFNKEYKAKYGPIAEAFEKRNVEAAKIAVPDEARLQKYGQILEDGMQRFGTDSPIYKVYNNWGQRMLAKDTIGGMDMIKTELGGEIDKALMARDTNMLQALRDVRTSIADFQESQITKQASNLEKLGAEGAGKMGADLIAERAAANESYRDFAKLSGELQDHIGQGNFRGAGSLMGKLENKVSAEQLMNKFSFKGNADFIPFLQKNFPEVYEKVKENELKRFLKPVVLSAKGESPVNIKKLSDLIEKGMAGQKEYVESILSPEAIQRIQAAARLSESIPNPKSSGTAGWMTKMFKDVPRNAGAAVAMVSGHNPLLGMFLGEMGQKLSRDVPDALRLAHLRYLGSDKPIKAEGFKAMVDFIHNTYKGENALSKAAAGVLKSGAQVLSERMMPDDASRMKLDKQITDIQKNPQKFMNAQGDTDLGHYMPDHQSNLSQSAATTVQYLQALKPHPFKSGPLDREIPPSPEQTARYNRALDIAQQPAIVLHHIKQGTLQATDVQDIAAMYPSTYKNLINKLSTEINSRTADMEPIPYKTRVGMSLFMGQPLDSSMKPENILAAQPKPAPQQQQQAKGSGKSMKSLGNKTNSMYQTPSQTSEKDRADRD